MSPLALLEPPKHHLCGLSVSLVATESELLRASYHGCSYSPTELETQAPRGFWRLLIGPQRARSAGP